MRKAPLLFLSLAFCAIVAGCSPSVKRPSLELDRSILLHEFIDHGKFVDQVVMQRIELAAGEKTPVQVHTVPMAGYVVAGRIQFQVEGSLSRMVSAGEAFYVPAYQKVRHLDATNDAPAKVVASYLMGNKDQDWIKH